MGIMSRFVRILKADIHGVMDQLEDKRLVLAQCLREMQEEIIKTEALLKETTAKQDKTAQRQKENMANAENLENDLDRAVEKNREDLARILIRKANFTKKQQEETAWFMEELAKQISGLDEDLEEKRLAHERLKLGADRYLRTEENKSRAPQAQDSFNPLDDHQQGISDEEVEMELERRREALAQRRAS